MSTALQNGVAVPLTSDSLINAMTQGYKWVLPSNRTLEWSISTGWFGESWNNPLAAALSVGTMLLSFQSYSNIRFSYAGYYPTLVSPKANGVEINISLDGANLFFTSNQVWARAHFPITDSASRGEIQLNIRSGINTVAAYEPGSAAWFAIVHEIGHTLGLKHPHDSGGTGRPTFNDINWSPFDIDLMTVMSYNDDQDWNRIAWDPASPMILDVLALQYLYGKNLATNAGNTLHTALRNNFYLTVWDASGNDTIDQTRSPEGWWIVLPEIQLSSLVDTRAGFCLPMIDKALNIPTSLTWLAGDIENAIGSGFSDDIQGNSLENALFGLSGHDTLSGGAGRDLVMGGSGNDVYIVSDNDTLLETEPLDSLIDAGGIDRVESSITWTLGSFFENLTLTGTQSIDGTGNGIQNILIGNSAANVLSGLGGNDVLNGAEGADTLLGGSGSDIYFVDSGDTALETTSRTSTIDSGGIDIVYAHGNWTLGNYFEHLTLTGLLNSRGNGNALTNIITGNSGNNTLFGAAGRDTLVGGAGNDTYQVDDADLIDEATVRGGLTDAGGNDTVIASLSWTLGRYVENLTLSGGGHLSGTGNTLNNSLLGNAGNNLLTGLSGNDTLDGGAGIDTLMGGSGNDVYYADSSDVISETTALGGNIDSGGMDMIITEAQRALPNFVETLVLSGVTNVNGTGNSLANKLIGNRGNNSLSGAEGNDTLNGGSGNDTLTGGAGNDVFEFTTGLNARANMDRITDFQVGNDLIALENSVMTGLGTATGSLRSAAFTSGAGRTTATFTEHRIIFNTTTGELFYDADGSGSAAVAIQVGLIGITSGGPITSSQFVII